MHMKPSAILKPARPALAIVAIAALGVAPGVLAQEANPAGTPSAVASTLPPVDLHTGTCADPVLEPWADLGNVEQKSYGDLADQLRNDLSGGDANNATPAAAVDTDGNGTIDDIEILGKADASNPPQMIWYDEAGVDADYQALFESKENGIIAVHQSPEKYDTILACGDLAGVQYKDMNRIVVPLESAGGSDGAATTTGQYHGFAVFGNDFGGKQTGVRVYLFDDSGAMGTPTADVTGVSGTPASGSGSTTGGSSSTSTATTTTTSGSGSSGGSTSGSGTTEGTPTGG